MADAPDRYHIIRPPPIPEGSNVLGLLTNESKTNSVEYIRRDAFPLDEIRDFVSKWSKPIAATDLGRDHSPWCPAMITTTGKCCCERGLMRCILSLLEGEG